MPLVKIALVVETRSFTKITCLQTETQEGSRGGTDEEEDEAHAKVPACHCGRFIDGHYGEAQHETRDPQGSERSSDQVCLSLFSFLLLD